MNELASKVNDKMMADMQRLRTETPKGILRNMGKHQMNHIMAARRVAAKKEFPVTKEAILENVKWYAAYPDITRTIRLPMPELPKLSGLFGRPVEQKVQRYFSVPLADVGLSVVPVSAKMSYTFIVFRFIGEDEPVCLSLRTVCLTEDGFKLGIDRYDKVHPEFLLSEHKELFDELMDLYNQGKLKRHPVLVSTTHTGKVIEFPVNPEFVVLEQSYPKDSPTIVVRPMARMEITKAMIIRYPTRPFAAFITSGGSSIMIGRQYRVIELPDCLHVFNSITPSSPVSTIIHKTPLNGSVIKYLIEHATPAPTDSLLDGFVQSIPAEVLQKLRLNERCMTVDELTRLLVETASKQTAQTVADTDEDDDE